MHVSINFLVRIAGMLTLAYLGYSVGSALSASQPTANELLATRLLTLAGAGLGLLTTHHWTIEPIRELLRYTRSISIMELTAVVFGAMLGLVFAVLLSIPLAQLPPPIGQFGPLAAAIALAYFGAAIFVARRKEIGDLLQSTRAARPLVLPQQLVEGLRAPRRSLLDTSAIIDGRIAAVAETGFLDGTLLVPHFVLSELQTLADSADELRRSKGRRGLDILNDMQKRPEIEVEVVNVEVRGTGPVDEKLVVLARQYGCPIVTNDHNLGRVAALQGVKVLSLNQLADAVRPPVAAGQDLRVRIRDVGREREQGISFLDDGTMVVVEEARRLLGQEVDVVVARVYQTQTGRIVFAHLSDERARRPADRHA